MPRRRYLDKAAPADATYNSIRPVYRNIQVKKKDTPQRRENEAAKARARAEQARVTPANPRQASIGPYREKTAIDKAGGRLYAAAEQRAKDAQDREAAGVVLNALFKPIMPSTYVDMYDAYKRGEVNNVTDALSAPYVTGSWSQRNPGKALATDLAVPFVVGKGTQLVDNGTRSLRLSRAMDRFLVAPNTSFKEVLSDANRFPIGYQFTNPFGRYRLGDLEVNNPQLFYRQGSVEMGEQFLKDGIVLSGEGRYPNPMYASGKLWYGIPTPKMLKEGRQAIVTTPNGLTFNFTKANEVAPKTDLLVSNSSTKMIPSNQNARPKPWVVKTSDGGNPTYGTTIVNEVRRIPEIEGAANRTNTTLYRFDPNYGYRRVKEYQDVMRPFENPIVDEAGNLTVKPITLLRNLYDRFPFGAKMSSIMNKGYKRRTNLAEHISDVVASAKAYPLPKNVSRQDFVRAALYHDLGKIINRASTHGSTSNYIVDILGLPTNAPVRNAIGFHMNPQEMFVNAPSLTKALHAADVGRGRPFEDLIERFPYLDYR